MAFDPMAVADFITGQNAETPVVLEEEIADVEEETEGEAEGEETEDTTPEAEPQLLAIMEQMDAAVKALANVRSALGKLSSL